MRRKIMQNKIKAHIIVADIELYISIIKIVIYIKNCTRKVGIACCITIYTVVYGQKVYISLGNINLLNNTINRNYSYNLCAR